MSGEKEGGGKTMGKERTAVESILPDASFHSTGSLGSPKEANRDHEGEMKRMKN